MRERSMRAQALPLRAGCGKTGTLRKEALMLRCGSTEVMYCLTNMRSGAR